MIGGFKKNLYLCSNNFITQCHTPQGYIRFCKSVTPLQRSCGVPANLLHRCNCFAEFPQTYYTAATPLRSSRRPVTSLQRLCGVPASLLHGCNAFAEVPQTYFSETMPLRENPTARFNLKTLNNFNKSIIN
ncbi:MAG: hypothetical protein LBU91_07160 [Bacteroidales bacterium]|jgi:hypothetical protein|nr:hypothetical protein [Bacteroidales bacterium]